MNWYQKVTSFIRDRRRAKQGLWLAPRQLFSAVYKFTPYPDLFIKYQFRVCINNTQTYVQQCFLNLCDKLKKKRKDQRNTFRPG